MSSLDEMERDTKLMVNELFNKYNDHDMPEHERVLSDREVVGAMIDCAIAYYGELLQSVYLGKNLKLSTSDMRFLLAWFSKDRDKFIEDVDALYELAVNLKCNDAAIDTLHRLIQHEE